MIPGYCPESAPPGEKAVYAALQSDSDTADWVVVHSLALADHVRQVQGEADFVAIVPGHGIAVIEIKSHQSVHRDEDGLWRLGSGSPTPRSPFQQANEAMHSVREFLLKKGINLHSIPLVSCAWFTGVRARTMLPPNPEWHDWQVLDSEDLTNAAGAVLRTLRGETRHLSARLKGFGAEGVGPDEEGSQRIALALRPRFELATVAGDRRRARESQLNAFIDEQFLALDSAEDNRQVLFTGPAGSGKTFLAMESARREIAKGNRGRLLCFNRFLGNRLRLDMQDVDGLTSGTFHRELMKLAGIQHVPDGASSQFWEEELPERALDALLEGDPDLLSDFLVVDEVQDLASDAYLDVLDLMVKGGLKEGRVLLFGDFERQSIFENERGRERLRAHAPMLSSHKLVTNCRNLPRIGFQANLLSNLQPGYSSFRRTDDGVDPDLVRYAAGSDQSALLASAIRRLKDEGFELHEITVLSPLREQSTAASSEDTWLRQILKEGKGLPAKPGQVQYSTIHAFKGLESPAVIITDLDEATTTDNNFEALLYVGLTRATDRLIAFIEGSTLRGVLGART
jgi:hypothetical protein